MPNARVIRFFFGAKSLRWLSPFSGKHLCAIDGCSEYLLVSWLGKEAMAGVGLADSFNMVIMAFFAAIDLGTTVVVAFSLGKRDRRRARAAARQSLVIMTIFATVLAAVIHYFGQQIIDVVAGEATPDVKALALTYLELTVLSYPAAAIALIGSGALRGAGNTKIPLLINGGMNILNIIISSILIYGIFLARSGICGSRHGTDHFALHRGDCHHLGTDDWF